MKETQNLGKDISRRKTYLDILRIVAVFFVIYAHSSATGSRIYQSLNNPFNIWVGLFLECLRCCNNWLFMMISGALLLGKNEGIKVIFSHRVFRMITALSIFSLFYIFVDNKFVSLNQVIIDIFHGNVRNEFWFIYSYIGYLLLLPVLRIIAQQITEDKMKYLMAVFLFFNFVLSIFYTFAKIPSFGVQFLFGGFIIYPLIGYYLSNHDQPTVMIVVLGVLSCVGLVLCSIATYSQFISTGEWSEDFIYRSESICSIFLFCLAKKVIRDSDIRFWSIVSSTAFGVYFLAPFLQKRLKPLYSIIDEYLPVIPSNILYILFVMLTAVCITIVLKRIPLLKKVL